MKRLFKHNERIFLKDILKDRGNGADGPINESGQNIHGHIIKLSAPDDFRMLEQFRHCNHRSER